MPTLVLLAGPNDVGKTTLIDRFPPACAEAFEFVGPDDASLLPLREKVAAEG